jgi:hypothetical protein
VSKPRAAARRSPSAPARSASTSLQVQEAVWGVRGEGDQPAGHIVQLGQQSIVFVAVDGAGLARDRESWFVAGKFDQACHQYASWDAAAKADQLDWAYLTLQPQLDPTSAYGDQQPGAHSPRERAALSTATLDQLGIVSAAQALSSETSIHRLHAAWSTSSVR